MPMKFDLDKYMSPVFVESGTGNGGGCRAAANAGFSKIHTIEVSKTQQSKARKRLQTILDKSVLDKCEMHFHLGDSIDKLPEIMAKLDTRATFWLDGHFQPDNAGKTKAGRIKCPIHEELEIIGAHHIKDHIILVDDVRLIRTGAWNTPGITEETVKARLKAINKEYVFTYEDGHIKDDCLVARVANR
jgi:hypothetical protein